MKYKHTLLLKGLGFVEVPFHLQYPTIFWPFRYWPKYVHF